MSLERVQTVVSWFKPRRATIREDRKHLEARARRLLKGYLSADAPRKQRYYEVIAGAAAACEPGVSDPNLENAQLAQAAAEAALKVVKLRTQRSPSHTAVPPPPIRLIRRCRSWGLRLCTCSP